MTVAAPRWDELRAARWGPGLEDRLPGIVVHPGWRWRVANLPHEEWVRWRRRATEILAKLAAPTADQIRAADGRAAAERGLIRPGEDP